VRGPAPPTWFVEAVGRTPEVRDCTVDGATITYRIYGRPAPISVILVHGAAANSRWWDHVAPLLASRWQVTTLDLSGHGDSSSREQYTISGWADEIVTVARNVSNGRPVVIVGHSIGGLATLDAKAKSPDVTVGTILIDTFLTDSWIDGAPQHRELFPRPVAHGTRDLAISRFRLMPHQTTMLDFVRDHVAEQSAKRVGDGWSLRSDSPLEIADLGHAMQYADEKGLAAFLLSEHGITDQRTVDWITNHYGEQAIVVELADAGHHPMFDQPLAMLTAIRTILAAWTPQLSDRTVEPGSHRAMAPQSAQRS